MILKSLNIIFSADTGKFNKGVKGVQEKLGALAKLQVGLTLAKGMYAAASGTIAYFKSIADGIDNQSKFATRINASYGALQDLSFAAGLAGVENEDLNKSLEKMSENIGEIATYGTGGALKAFEQLGLSVESLKDMKAEKQFEAIARGLSKIDNAGAKLAVTKDIFGKGGGGLGVILDDVAKRGEEAYNFLSKIGLTISDLDAKRVEEMNDSFSTTGTILKAMSEQIVVGMAPSMKALTDEITRMLTNENAMKSFASAVDILSLSFAVLSDVAAASLKVIGGIKDVADLAVKTAFLAGVGINKGIQSTIGEQNQALVNETNKLWDDTISSMGTDLEGLGSLFDDRETATERYFKMRDSLNNEKSPMFGGDSAGTKNTVTYAQKFEAKLVDVAALSQSGLKTESQKQTAELKLQTQLLRAISEKTGGQISADFAFAG